VTALVGPLQRVAYRHGWDEIVTRFEDLPQDTRDWRYIACVDHHPACWCREAERSEMLAEYRSEMRDARRIESAARAILLMHARRPGNLWRGDSCTACHEPYPCPTRVLLKGALWPYPDREDYPL